MDKELIIFLFIIKLQFLTAEVVYSDPNFATELDSITVYFNAAEGDLTVGGDISGINANLTGILTASQYSAGLTPS